jgi:SAM-dependent methyltransferase
VETDVDSFQVEELFDLVASHTALHHVPNLDDTLRRMTSFLRPGGRLILLDNYSRRPWIRARPVLFRSALRTLFCWCFVVDVFERGPTNARTLLRCRLSRSWMDHVTSDNHLTEEAFRDAYSRVLPGARFNTMRHFMGVVWDL